MCKQRVREEEDVRGSFFFFSFLLPSLPSSGRGGRGDPLSPCRPLGVSDRQVNLHQPLLPLLLGLLLLRLLLLLPSGLQRRGREEVREEECTPSPAARARDGRASCGKPLKSAAGCCRSSAARAQRECPAAPSGGRPFGRRGASFLSCSSCSSCVFVGLRTARAHITTVM